MAAFEIRRIDPLAEPLLRQWWECGHAAAAGRPYDVFPPWQQARLSLTLPSADFDLVLLAAVDGHDTIVGSALVNLPLADNRHLAFAEYAVPAARRRQGIGSMLLEAGETYARRAGRSVSVTEVAAPVDADSDGLLFAAALGYTVGNLEEHKVLDLVADEPDWDALQAGVDQRASEYRGEYRIVTWRSSTPDEYAVAFCHLLSRFNSQIPLGDLPLGDVAWTPERLRRGEERMRRQGRDAFVAAALAPDGSLVGESDLRLLAADPRISHVGTTMVLPGHRGHRLGLGLKLATHRSLRATYPRSEVVTTGNARLNAHMSAINAQLGYRVVERLFAMQKEL